MNPRIRSQKVHVTYDDVCLVPSDVSTVDSRTHIDTSSKLPKGYELHLPVITSAMDTITSREMAEAVVDHGGGVFHHRHQSVDERKELLQSINQHDSIQNKCALNGVAVGLSVSRQEVENYIHSGANLIGIEVAHAYHEEVAKTARRIGPMCKEHGVLLMVGNFSTVESVQWLEEETGNLVDIVKVSQGGGSVCSTRVVTGIGKPTLQAVLDLTEASTRYDVVADGGIRSSGDVAKSLGAGACAGMIGNLISATDETPGDIIELDDKQYKKYRGMSSRSSKKDAEDILGHTRPKHVEGVSTLNPYQGSARDVFKQIREGIQSSVSCCGFESVETFKDEAEFIRISNAAAHESKPHGDL